MNQKFLHTIKKYNMIGPGDHVIVGLSGGPDSLAMFHMLFELSKSKELTLHAVHVNHKFRPGAAEEDQEFVENYCRDLGVDEKTFVVDCNERAREEGLTSEEAGRNARYEAFDKVADELFESGIPRDKIKIATAHNLDDQAETLLFRVLRGTGIRGLRGILPRRESDKGFIIIRPIIEIERKEIEDYCLENSLKPRIDKTNKDNYYSRNRIRNILIPVITKEFDNAAISNIARLANISQEENEYLDSEAGKYISSADVEEIRSIHPALRHRLYVLKLALVGLKDSLTSNQIEEMDKVLFSDSPSASIMLPGEIVVKREYDRFVIDKGQRVDSMAQWSIREIESSELEKIKNELEEKHSTYGIFYGFKKEDLKIRTREDGDKICLKIGTKKLQDFLVDEKVPKLKRDEVLVLAHGKDVLWVLPSEIFENERLKEKGRFAKQKETDLRDPILVERIDVL